MHYAKYWKELRRLSGRVRTGLSKGSGTVPTLSA